MRKRSKYRPRPIIANPLAYVVESHTLLCEHDSYALKWKITNHEAMLSVTQGHATKKDVDTLMAAHNITEALVHILGVPDEDGTVVRSQAALIDLTTRANAIKRVVLKAPEMQALNDLMALHDNLMDVITVQQMEKALAYAKKEIKAKRCVTLKGELV